MSSNALVSHVSNTPPKAAADISFVPVGDSYAESSSAASARSSGDKRRSTNASNNMYTEHTRVLSRDDDLPMVNSHKGRLGKSGGFLLESVFTNASPRFNEMAHHRRHGNRTATANGTSHVEKRTLPNSRLSVESSQRSSPLSRQFSHDEAKSENTESRPESRGATIDPAQLIQMALSLSEGRKRQVSNTLQAPASPNGRRIVSGLEPAFGIAKTTPPRSAQHMNRLADGSPHQPPVSLVSSQDVGDQGDISIGEDNALYTFSQATLGRAEKARRYFELASEHRRLLEHLPPLKPDVTAPGDPPDVNNATRMEGDMSRVGTYFHGRYQLGRPYNPLQALRDRQIRNKERKQLTAPAEGFQDTACIKGWIDDVANASKEPDFRPGEDQIVLPGFSSGQRGDNGFNAPESSGKHRRTDTIGSAVISPENGWVIEPAELLANTYWVEKNDNKTLIEDRMGRKIFPSRKRSSFDPARRSVDSSSQWNDADIDRRSDQHDSGPDEKSKHRHRRKIHIPDRLRRHKDSRLMRSDSVSTTSSVEGRKPPPLQFGSVKGGDENIGPLERHMRDMIAQDEAGELSSSPDLRSPDHWDSRNRQYHVRRESLDERRLGTARHHANGHLMTGRQRHPIAKSAAERPHKNDHASSSVEDIIPESPNSPTVPQIVQPANTITRDNSAESNNQVRRVPLLRSRSKDLNHIEQTDFATQFGTSLSPVHSAENSDISQGRNSLEIPQQSDVRRQFTPGSSTNNLKRLNTGSTVAGSINNSISGRRFFKAGRIGELMRNESSRFGDRFRGGRDRSGEISDVSRTVSDFSDVDDELPRNRLNLVADNRGDDSDVSPRSSLDRGRSKPKYFISNLPSFISPAGRDKRATTAQPDNDPISRQQKAHREAGRSPRFNRLAPPRINLPDDEKLSNADTRSYLEPEDERYRLSSVARSARASSVSFESPRASDTTLSRRNAKSGAAGFDTKRQWSISDQSRPERKPVKVGHRDVERVRTLLLASGIKAHEILQQGNTVPQTPPILICAASRTAGAELHDVPRKEAHLAAARALSSSLRITLTNFEDSVTQFESSTAKNLSEQLDDLRRRAGDQLTKLVHETSDEADAFNVELTTRPPQEIKRVDDAVEILFRRRRRQFRLVRRAGFKLLEWLVLGIMWWVWFVFVLINTSKKTFLGILGLLKWLIWF